MPLPKSGLSLAEQELLLMSPVRIAGGANAADAAGRAVMAEGPGG
jgi:hypothetical protein